MSNNSNELTIEWLLNAATSDLDTLSDTAKLDAEVMLCEVLDCNRTYLFTWSDKKLTDDQVTQFQAMLKRRLNGEPVAHIVGHRDFWTLSLKVNPSTLIPRPDTETLVERALDIATGLTPTFKGLDLGTGTGAIALALASELPQSKWLGVDLKPEAVALATQNAQFNNISNCEFKQSNWFSSIESDKFDIVVSNPPYIDEHDPHLVQGDVRFEPLSALVAADSGLADINIIAEKSRHVLTSGGVLLMEHGYNQGSAVRAILAEFNYQNVETIKDISGNDRVTVGYFI